MIESTNPCGEQPLLPYEACNLGSINLSKMVSHQGVDFEKLRTTVHNSVRFLDNVIEMNQFPLKKIEDIVRGNRKIGLGVMGWADMLMKLGIQYNSEDALNFGEEIMGFIQKESKAASRQLAVERGPFPNFSKSVFALRNEPPIRNATTTTIAPTGTISIIAGASSGIEPLYAICFVRNVLDGTKMIEVNTVFEAIAQKEGFYSKSLMEQIAKSNSVQNIEEIPPSIRRIFVAAHDIAPSWHIRMQAAFQKHTDNAVSKTVNFRNEATREDISEVYFLAYKTGCKGVTVYRDGCRQNQVLSTSDTTKTEKTGKSSSGLSITPRPRPDVTFGMTRKLKTGCGTLYVTINYDDNKHPFELFSTMGKAGGCAASQAEAISRLISFALRSGASVKEIITQIKGISCHSISWSKGGKILSCADAIARALEEAFDNTHTLNKAPIPHMVEGSPVKRNKSDSLRKGACPECGASLAYEEGCMHCYSCSYSECD
jgi:ribonucleoside-diphosphate reductase alpha chain